MKRVLLGEDESDYVKGNLSVDPESGFLTVRLGEKEYQFKTRHGTNMAEVFLKASDLLNSSTRKAMEYLNDVCSRVSTEPAVDISGDDKPLDEDGSDLNIGILWNERPGQDPGIIKGAPHPRYEGKSKAVSYDQWEEQLGAYPGHRIHKSASTGLVVAYSPEGKPVASWSDEDRQGWVIAPEGSPAIDIMSEAETTGMSSWLDQNSGSEISSVAAGDSDSDDLDYERVLLATDENGNITSSFVDDGSEEGQEIEAR